MIENTKNIIKVIDFFSLFKIIKNNKPKQIAMKDALEKFIINNIAIESKNKETILIKVFVL